MSDAQLLQTFPNPRADRHYLIVHTADEFTSLCPITGQPDFARLTLRYVADQTCVELRSLKQYLQSYRSDGIFYEDVTNRILDDLVQCCAPRWMELRSRWSVRGGIHTTVVAQHGNPSVVPPADHR
ncbi:MAG: NADPH-dependent 7-cyano-7-deazaguanine reductase QueF [Phycisphaerales bacterium]|nr:NADPH-dependent 7-cyano-7-deazaguanine reductase QueF [Phycisphaerales bacterium]